MQKEHIHPKILVEHEIENIEHEQPRVSVCVCARQHVLLLCVNTTLLINYAFGMIQVYVV